MNNSILDKFLGKNILYNVGGLTKKTPMQTSQKYDFIVKQNLNYGKDIYFYLNEGGTKVEDIKKFRALFLDLDAGRDSNGKYKSLREVNTFKKKAEKVIKAFPVKPSVVTETRNGFQLIWFYKNLTYHLSKFNEYQSKLWHWFDEKGITPDPNCLRANQLFRVPESVWYKKWEGKQSFECINRLDLCNMKLQNTALLNFFDNYKLHASKLTVSPKGVLALKDKKNKFYKNTVSFHKEAKTISKCEYTKYKVSKSKIDLVIKQLEVSIDMLERI